MLNRQHIDTVWGSGWELRQHITRCYHMVHAAMVPLRVQEIKVFTLQSDCWKEKHFQMMHSHIHTPQEVRKNEAACFVSTTEDLLVS